ncbi:coiled-coil domain-containing protein 125 [Aulostomus maculatus]
MQDLSEASSLDDDMVDGDLGDGMKVRAVSSSSWKKSESSTGPPVTILPNAELLSWRSQAGDTTWIQRVKTAEWQQRTRWKMPHTVSSLANMTEDELKARLQEASEMIDVLYCELEVAHRYLEGKYEALKILQGKAILDKATSHTKSLLQKSEERAKGLEKEVNSLQWELSFTQVQLKKSEQSWEQRYNRMLSESKTLTDILEEKEHVIQRLQAENSALNQQCLAPLSMSSVIEQRTLQGSKPQYCLDASVSELAVLGACRCFSTEACPCSRMAAATRKQLVQLQQKLDAQQLRREEALMVADAFRIAFEQQLRRRSEDFMAVHHLNPEGANRSPLISVREKLRGLLPSSLEMKMPDNLLETLHRLLDLLNDKEEALAHQKKVSIMLAHSAEELQKQLHVEPHCQPSEPPKSEFSLKRGQHPVENRGQHQQTPASTNFEVQINRAQI